RIGRHVLKNTVLGPPIEKPRRIEVDEVLVSFFEILENADQSFRLSERQRFEQDTVNQAEDRRVRADPEGQRQQRRRRKCFVLQKHSQSKPQVLKHLILQSLGL